MFFGFISRFRPRPPVPPAPAETLQIGARSIPLLVVRNPRARRYLLRVQADGSARMTIPRGGSRSFAQAFLERHRGWLEKQLDRVHSQARLPAAWQIGSEFLFRGEMVRLESAGAGSIHFGTETLAAPDAARDLRPAVERHLRALAGRELPARLRELAAPHQLQVHRITVRSQRTRWGSCSRRGTISLNWRLVLVPGFVRDYILFHELAHLRQMNHSPQFWSEVARLCPDFRTAEKWLKLNRCLLR